MEINIKEQCVHMSIQELLHGIEEVQDEIQICIQNEDYSKASVLQNDLNHYKSEIEVRNLSCTTTNKNDGNSVFLNRSRSNEHDISDFLKDPFPSAESAYKTSYQIYKASCVALMDNNSTTIQHALCIIRDIVKNASSLGVDIIGFSVDVELGLQVWYDNDYPILCFDSKYIDTIYAKCNEIESKIYEKERVLNYKYAHRAESDTETILHLKDELQIYKNYLDIVQSFKFPSICIESFRTICSNVELMNLLQWKLLDLNYYVGIGNYKEVNSEIKMIELEESPRSIPLMLSLWKGITFTDQCDSNKRKCSISGSETSAIPPASPSSTSHHSSQSPLNMMSNSPNPSSHGEAHHSGIMGAGVVPLPLFIKYNFNFNCEVCFRILNRENVEYLVYYKNIKWINRRNGKLANI